MEYVREGDTLVVTRLDRLAQSTLHLCQIAVELERKGVDLHVLDQNINTADATGRLLFNMLGAIAQKEYGLAGPSTYRYLNEDVSGTPADG